MADAISQCIEAWQTHSTKADLRSQLRSLWDANIEIPDYEITKCVQRSDYVGSASNQISPRPTGSGLRDSLPINLTMVLMGKLDSLQVSTQSRPIHAMQPITSPRQASTLDGQSEQV